jgi:hypothetical protein
MGSCFQVHSKTKPVKKESKEITFNHSNNDDFEKKPETVINKAKAPIKKKESLRKEEEPKVIIEKEPIKVEINEMRPETISHPEDEIEYYADDNNTKINKFNHKENPELIYCLLSLKDNKGFMHRTHFQFDKNSKLGLWELIEKEIRNFINKTKTLSITDPIIRENFLIFREMKSSLIIENDRIPSDISYIWVVSKNKTTKVL